MMLICYSIADRLHQPYHEVVSWPIDTVYGWVAYFAIRDEEAKK